MSESNNQPNVQVSVEKPENDQLKQMVDSIVGYKIPSYFISIFLTIMYIILATYFIRVSKNYVQKVVRKINHYDQKEEKQETEEEFQNRKIHTIETISFNILKTFIWLMTFTLIFSSWGVSIGPILAGAGIMGVAIGFSAQSFFKDIINGFVIMFSGHVSIGDTVQIKEYKGKIVDINLSVTTLKTENGNDIYIPNGSIDIISKIQ